MPVLNNSDDLCLGKNQRLTKSTLFKEAFEGGKALHGKYLVVFIRTGEGASRRLGVVAGRKCNRLAVGRNKAKRKLREVYRVLRHKIFVKDIDIVLVARAGAVKATLDELTSDLTGLLIRAGLMGGKSKGKIRKAIVEHVPASKHKTRVGDTHSNISD
ncbi:MAG: ribonuclease P protein component [Lentisphaerae bacterium]|nr:ribonuclease P protein component [Lentisphaerota bacterium]